MKSNQGFIVPIILVIIAILAGTGGVVYVVKKSASDKEAKSNQSGNADIRVDPNSTNTPPVSSISNDVIEKVIAENSLAGLSPTQVYKKMANDLRKTKSFEDFVIVHNKYLDAESIKKHAEVVKAMHEEDKQSYYNLLQIMVPAESRIKEIKEEITGDTAKLTVYLKEPMAPGADSKLTLRMMKNSGVWKMSQ